MKRRALTVAAALITSMAVSFIIFAPAADAAPRKTYPTTGTVTRIIDGNRIEIKTPKGTKYKIRLAHVWAYRKTRCMEMDAKEYMNYRLKGVKVRIEGTSYIGRRYITAWVFDTEMEAYGHDVPIQGELAGAGMSLHKGTKNRYDAAVANLQDEAKDLQVGKYDHC